MGVLKSLIENDFKIHFVSCGKQTKLDQSDIISNQNIIPYITDPNDEENVSSIFSKIGQDVKVAIFDTFVSEEMFR